MKNIITTKNPGYIWCLYRDLKETPELIAKRFMLGCIIVIIISSIPFVCIQGDSIWKVLASISSSIAASALAAALFTISSGMRQLWHHKLKKEHFLKLLSTGHPNANFVIVLPGYPNNTNHATQSETGKKETNSIIHGPSGSAKSISESDTCYASKNDVCALIRIITLFEDVGLPAPDLMFETEALKKFKNNCERTTFICIGLGSNEFVMNYYKNTDQRFYEVIPGGNQSPQIRSARNQANKEASAKTNNNTTITYTDDIIYIYSLMAKHTTKSDNTIFVLGGLNAPGTKMITDYFTNKWQDILNILEANQNGAKGQNALEAVVRFANNGDDRDIVEINGKSSN